MLKVQAEKMGSVAVLSLQGQIVNGETEILRNAVHSLGATSAVILDLSRVTTVDAGGLGVMLALREQVESKGIHFQLINITRQVSRLLEITRLDSVFQITSGTGVFPVISRSRPATLTLASCA